MSFRVDLELFRGPLDLLLYLVRKHEVDIVDIPIATIASQFVEHLEVLERLDVNSVGDFLEMASTLAEIKSRMILPRAGEVEEEIEDPRQDLVRRLLEYKQFRDAASILEERSRTWQERFPRLGRDLPPRERNLADEPIHELELWDLVGAFGRLMRESRETPASNIVYDDTPLHVYMTQIHERLAAQGRISFSELFQQHMHKSKLIGIFLAVLELIRHHGVRADQRAMFGEISILPGDLPTGPVDPAVVSRYEGEKDEGSGARDQG
jgi:segregation and condensation protein A